MDVNSHRRCRDGFLKNAQQRQGHGMRMPRRNEWRECFRPYSCHSPICGIRVERNPDLENTMQSATACIDIIYTRSYTASCRKSNTASKTLPLNGITKKQLPIFANTRSRSNWPLKHSLIRIISARMVTKAEREIYENK